MPHLIRIDDPEDPRVEPFRNVRERDLVGRRGHFIAEGKVVVEKLVGAPGVTPLSLLIAEGKVAHLMPVLSQLAEGVPIHVASRPIIETIAGFDVHRGILALGRRTETSSAHSLLSGPPDRAIVLHLSAIANHDNMGGIFRNAAAFGASAVLLDAHCCDPLYRKSIRVSVGATLLVPWVRLQRDEDPIAVLAQHGFVPIALSPSAGQRLSDLAPPPRAAVLLGAEGPGLVRSMIDRALPIRIPMSDGFDSLNVATTSGIVLHHLRETPA